MVSCWKTTNYISKILFSTVGVDVRKFFRGTKGQMVTITIALTMILSSLGAMAWLNTEGQLERPDLIIKKIEHSPHYPFKNEIVTIITSISNQGTADAYGIEIALYSDNSSTIPLDIITVPFLGKNQNKTINIGSP